MKVKCINNKDKFGDIYLLTISKTYDVIYVDENGDYSIIDDKGFNWYYPRDWFKKLSEIRNEKIDRLLRWK